MQSHDTASERIAVSMINEGMICQIANEENVHTGNPRPEPSSECEQKLENNERSYAMTPLPIVPLDQLWVVRTTPIDDDQDERPMEFIPSGTDGSGKGHHHGHGRFTGVEQVNYQWTRTTMRLKGATLPDTQFGCTLHR